MAGPAISEGKDREEARVAMSAGMYGLQLLVDDAVEEEFALRGLAQVGVAGGIELGCLARGQVDVWRAEANVGYQL